MSKRLRRAVVFGLSAGLVLTSLAGCSKKDKMDLDAAAITVNGDTVPLGVLNFAVRYEQAGLEDAYMSFGVTDPFNQDLFGAGETLGDMAKEQYSEQLTHALLAEQKMGDYGVSVTEEDKADIDAAAAAFVEANDAEVLETIGVTQEYVARYLELEMIQHRMEQVMPQDIDTEVSDEEAAQRRVQYVLFTPVTEEETEAETSETEGLSGAVTPAETEGLSENVTPAETEGESVQEEASLVQEDRVLTAAADETETEVETTAAETSAEEETETETEDPETAAAMARALVQAEEFLARIEAGEDFETTADDMGKVANEITLGADYYVEELAEATEGLADGTLVETPIKTESGYYVAKVISQLDREATDEEKENIIEQRKTDRIAELYEEWETDGEVSQDAELIAQIVFDYSLTMPTEAEETEIETEAGTDITPAEEVAAEMEADTDITPAEEAAAETEADTDITLAEEAAAETEADTDITPAEEAAAETETGTEPAPAE